jgi:hypothetical protein
VTAASEAAHPALPGQHQRAVPAAGHGLSRVDFAFILWWPARDGDWTRMQVSCLSLRLVMRTSTALANLGNGSHNVFSMSLTVGPVL